MNINNYNVECKQRIISNSVGDIILLTGATTFSGTYFLFNKYFKHFNITIINTPEHGNTNGEAITDANSYIEFYEEAIVKLIEKGYCISPVNLVGYSLGGMTLYHLLQRGKLSSYLNKSVFLFSAYRTNSSNLDKVLNQLESKTKSSLKNILLNNFNFIAPVPFNLFPRDIFFASNRASINDFLLCKSINLLSKNTRYCDRGYAAYIIATKDEFFTIEDIIITKCKLKCPFLNIYNKSHFSPLNRPKTFVSLIEDFILEKVK